MRIWAVPALVFAQAVAPDPVTSFFASLGVGAVLGTVLFVLLRQANAEAREDRLAAGKRIDGALAAVEKDREVLAAERKEERKELKDLLDRILEVVQEIHWGSSKREGQAYRDNVVATNEQLAEAIRKGRGKKPEGG